MRQTTIQLVLLFCVQCLQGQSITWITPYPDDLQDGIYFCEESFLNFKVYINLNKTASIDKNRLTVLIDGKHHSYNGAKLDAILLKGASFSGKIPITRDEHVVVIEYKSKQGDVIRSQPLTMRFGKRLPVLHLLAFGPPTNTQPLLYNNHDAWDFANAFRGQASGPNKLYSDIRIKVLVDSLAEATDILGEIETYRTMAGTPALSGSIHEDDLMVFYASSHGFVEGDSNYYLHKANYDPLKPVSTSLKMNEVIRILGEIPCKKIILVDACRTTGAKSIDKLSLQDIMNKMLKTQSGFSIILSSQPGQFSFEDKAWENGAFTEALLEALSGLADTDNNEVISLNELTEYLLKRVSPMVESVKNNGSQQPDIVRNDLGDMPFFLLENRGKNKIPYPYSRRIKHPQVPEYLLPKDMVTITGGIQAIQTADGTDDDQVEIQPFYMDKYEVTYDQYDIFCKDTRRVKPGGLGWNRGKLPIVGISWFDAVNYCNWRSKKEGLEPYYILKEGAERVIDNPNANGYRLPFEAEWEWAAMHDLGAESIPADSLLKKGWLGENSGNGPREVGSLPPNALGIHDLIGNASEWCNDWYNEFRKTTSSRTQLPLKVIRGGSWRDLAIISGPGHRSMQMPGEGKDHIGFRCVRNAVNPSK